MNESREEVVSGEETLTEPVVMKNEDLAVEKVRQALII